MDSANSAFLCGTGLGINIESIESPFGYIESGAKVFNVGEAYARVAAKGIDLVADLAAVNFGDVFY